MSILVTGGAGFIGSHLCKTLLEDNHKVICIDNFITSSKKNISHLLDNKNFSLIKHDVTKEPLPITNYPRLPAPEAAGNGGQELPITDIFHLASPASPVDYHQYPIETMLTNAYGTHNVLELAKRNRVKTLIASTSEVYGDPEVHPQPESYFGTVNPVGPRSCYDESKRFAEALAMVYLKKYHLDVVIVRIFNTFGPKMRINDGRAVPNFITQALGNEPLTVYGDGSQTRSFCYIDDLVEGLVKAMFSDKTSGEIVNLGNNQEMTILDLANRVKEICNSHSKLQFLPLPQDDPSKRQPNLDKAKKLLGWQPKTPLDEGLKQVIKWFKKELEKEK